MTKRCPLPAPLPWDFHPASWPGAAPELAALSRGAEPEHHAEHFALRRGAGASSQGRDQLCRPPPRHFTRSSWGHGAISGSHRAAALGQPRARSVAAGGCRRGGGGLEVAVNALPRHHAQDSAPSCGARALALQKKKTQNTHTKKNIPLMSVRLCDPPSVPGPSPPSCVPRPPSLSAARTEWAPRCRSWAGGGAPHPVPGLGRARGCRRELLPSVFTPPRGETKACASPPLLRGGERGWGRCPVPPTPSQCYYAKAAAGRSACREAMRPPGARGSGGATGQQGQSRGAGEQHPAGGPAPGSDFWEEDFWAPSFRGAAQGRGL